MSSSLAVPLADSHACHRPRPRRPFARGLARIAGSARRWSLALCAAATLAAPIASEAQVLAPFAINATVGVPVSQPVVIPLQYTTAQLAAVDPATVLFSTTDLATLIFLANLGKPELADGTITAGDLATAYPGGTITIDGFTATVSGDPRFGLNATACAAPVGLTCTAQVSYNGAIPAGLAVLTIDGDVTGATISGLGDAFLEGLINTLVPTILASFDGLTTFTVNATVAKGAQTITFGTAPAGIAVGTTGTVSATATSGLAVTFTSTTPSICSVSGTTVTGIAAGTCTIAGNQAGNTNYNPAPQATQSFSIAKASQAITFGTAPTVTVGATGTVSATGGPSGNPVVFASTTPSTCSISGATVTGIAVGTCTISANQAGNANYNAAPQVTQSFQVGANPNPPRLANISTRMQVLTGDDVMIGGFVIGGSANKRVAIVATGPSLAAFGITNPLANPMLTVVRSSDQSVVTSNDDWQAHASAPQLQTAGFAPVNPLEAAVLADLAPGAYTAIVQGSGDGTGVAVIGVYEIGQPTIPLVNISTRGRVLTGNDVMIGGFVIQGSGPQTVAIVATGPSLAQFGIASPLANPTISLVRSSDQAVLATNDDWQADAQQAQLQAAGFAPTNPLESGLYRTLAPGAYTVIVQGVSGGTGIGVIGVYKVN